MVSRSKTLFSLRKYNEKKGEERIRRKQGALLSRRWLLRTSMRFKALVNQIGFRIGYDLYLPFPG